jgi:hypothetical protein
LYGGTPGLFNQLVVDFGQETDALLHGKKAVLNEDQLYNMSKGISQASLSESFKNVKNLQTKGNEKTMPTASNFQGVLDTLGTAKTQGNEKTMPMASNFQGGLDTLGTAKTQEMLKVLGITATGEAKAQASTMATAARTTATSEESKTKPIETREASLNDVVSKLDKLNINISKLNDSFLEIGSKQIKAVKANSKNLYERA